MADDWRIIEVLKLLRQCVVCPSCGVLVATQAGVDAHLAWHDGVNAKVADIDTNFNTINTYVTDPSTGLEKRFADLIQAATIAITTLRTDATTAIGTTNSAVDQVRTDAANAITQLRNDATTAITALSARVTALGG